MPYKTLLAILLCALLSACAKTEPTSAFARQFPDLNGRWLLINYWAEWCKPCLEEMPELNAFNREFAATAVVYAVNFDGTRGEQLQEQVARLGIDIPILEEDPAAALGYPRPQALPTTLVFSPEGKLQIVLQGQQTKAALAAAIAPAPTPAPAPDAAP